MSVEHAKAFLTRVADDGLLRDRLSACRSIEQRFEIVREAGFLFTLDELNDARTVLSDEDLDAVAGGVFMGGKGLSDFCFTDINFF